MNKEAWRLMQKLTFRRLWNACLVVSSFYLSRLLRRPIVWGLPITISIEPTTACNLRCPECPSGLRAFSRPTGNLKSDFFRSIIDQVHRELLYLIFYFQGEPYINPNFLEMVQHASQHGIYTITSTNGHFLDEENAKKTVKSGLDRLIISVDGTTQEVYEQYRKGGNLSQVLEGARNIIQQRRAMNASHPYVIFQFLVVRPNEHQIEAIHRIAEEVGVDEVCLKTAQIYDYANGNPLIPTQEKYARYRQQADGTYRPKHRLVNYCWKLWHACVVTWNGTVVPCCFDKDANYAMGALQTQSFRDIWHSSPYQNFRKTLFRGREHIDICTNCSEGCKVWA